MARKPKKRDFSKELFARPGAKENFFTLTGRARSAFGAKNWREPNINISGAGAVDRKAPNIAASGPATASVPDLGSARGSRRDRRSRVPAISGGGRATDGAVPQIGAGGSRRGRAPDLGRAPGGRRRKTRVPSLGGRGDDDAVPRLGGNAPGTPMISGAVGASGDFRTARARAQTIIGRRVGWLARATGRFAPLTNEQEDEFDLFLRRAVDAGHDVSNRTVLSWKADVMVGKMDAEDLWRTDVGEDIERRYGRRGEYLDLPEDERPTVGFIRERPERKDAGIAPSLIGIARRVGRSSWRGFADATGQRTSSRERAGRSLISALRGSRRR